MSVDTNISRPINRPTQENSDCAELSLVRRCQRLSTRVMDLAIEAGAGNGVVGLTSVRGGTNEIVEGLWRLAPKARRTIWNMQPSILSFDPEDPTLALNELSRARGVDLQLITTRRALVRNPLLTSQFPEVLVGPVHLRTILIDRVCAVIEGPLMPTGDGTAWLVTRTDLVAEVCWIWRETRQLSRTALPEGSPTPLTKRQYVVACRLATGAKDASIARELGISARTVATEVEAVFQLLGATSRVQAGLFMRGGSPNDCLPERESRQRGIVAT